MRRPRFGQIVARCLSKQPEARFPSAGDLERALRHVRDDVSRRPTRRQLLLDRGRNGGCRCRRHDDVDALAADHAGRSAVCQPRQERLGRAPLPWPDADLIQRMHHLPVTVKSFSLVTNFAGSSIESPRHRPATRGRQGRRRQCRLGRRSPAGDRRAHRRGERHISLEEEL